MGDGRADPRRRVPRTDVLLADPRLATAAATLGRDRVKAAVRQAQDRARRGEIDPDEVRDAVLAALPPAVPRAVLNATGVLLHTNLGRAALSEAAVAAVVAAAGHTDVELDLGTGRRARRGRDALAALAAAVPGAEAVHVVNNGAAALVLAATALAADAEIVVSRGELVEIGDGFRLPDLLASTGARLREVGTTNRSTLADYAAAIGGRTGFVLKVHPSNFRVTGFTSSVPVRRAGRARRAGGRRHRLRAARPRSGAARRAGRGEHPARPGRAWSPRAATSCSAAPRPGCCSATPGWSSGCAGIRWPGRCGWTS